MAARPTNVTVRADLTNYAYGIMQDVKAALRIAKILSPIVPTGATSGAYNKFNDSQAFKAYADSVARRAVGGQANSVGFLSETADYSAKPYGLRVSVDNHERLQAANNTALLEQAKTRTLTINCVMAYLANVVTIVKAAVAAEAGKGTWGGANVDPIQELNDLIKAVWLASGIVPNHIMMDFGAWCVLAGNGNVLKRMPGADVAAVTPMRIAGMLVNPNATIDVVDTAVLYGGGLGNSAATKRGVLQGTVLAFYNSEVADVYDPSFCKTFSPSANLFTDVYTYREEPHLDWFENDWTCQPVVVASSLCKRIDVTGANS